jgi:hypothetical protein
MSIDLSEEFIPLTQVPGLPFVPHRRRGKKLNQATVFRWAQSGIKGIRLETIRFGGTLCTTRSALLEFFRSLAPANDPATSPPRRTVRQQQQAADRAGKELEQLGI